MAPFYSPVTIMVTGFFVELAQVDKELAIEAFELRRSQKLTRSGVEGRLIRWVALPAVMAGFTWVQFTRLQQGRNILFIQYEKTTSGFFAECWCSYCCT